VGVDGRLTAHARDGAIAEKELSAPLVMRGRWADDTTDFKIIDPR
jgi:hypothetical protein